MGATVGIHLIWTTYGTWLPGDPSKPGHWSPLFDLYGRLRAAGHRLNLPDTVTFEVARSLMKEPAKVLSAEEQRIVAEVMGRQFSPTAAPAKAGAMCERVRAMACAVEPTHVHLLTGPVHEDIGRFVGRLKGTTSGALVKHPDNWGRTRIWTAGYWKVFLFDADALPTVAGYIESHNTRRGLTASRFDWLTPIT
jgi:REP element-mobilizing transposase RayT